MALDVYTDGVPLLEQLPSRAREIRGERAGRQGCRSPPMWSLPEPRARLGRNHTIGLPRFRPRVARHDDVTSEERWPCPAVDTRA